MLNHLPKLALVLHKYFVRVCSEEAVRVEVSKMGRGKIGSREICYENTVQMDIIAKLKKSPFFLGYHKEIQDLTLHYVFI